MDDPEPWGRVQALFHVSYLLPLLAVLQDDALLKLPAKIKTLTLSLNMCFPLKLLKYFIATEDIFSCQGT